MSLAIVFRAIVIALLIAFAGVMIGDFSPVVRVSLLTILIIFLWATAIVPEYFGALVFFALVLVSGVATEKAALAGFQSKAVWLALAGAILGVAIHEHKLGNVLFNRLLRRINSYKALIWSISSSGLLLSFLVPSAMGRVVMMAPLVLAICDKFGLAKGSPARIGVCLSILAGSVLPAMTILPANVPNVVMLGAMEASYGRGITYVDYLILNFPVLGIGTFLIVTALISWLFPGHIDPVKDEDKPAVWTAKQKHLALILALTLGFWGTDALHGISAAWIGLAAAVICMTPFIGVIPPKLFNSVNFGPWFFVAGAIGLGAVVRESGMVANLWQGLSSVLPLADFSAPFQYISIVLGTVGLAILSTMPAMPSIFTPMATAVAQTTGWPVDAVVLAQVPAFIFFMFPYQAPPVLISLMLMNIPAGQMVKFLVAQTILGLVVLVPLHYLWGRMLGVFP